MTHSEKTELLLMAGIGALVLFWPKITGMIAQSATEAAGNVATGVATGLNNSVITPIVGGVGAAIGAPPVNATNCAAAQATGSTWSVMQDCSIAEAYAYFNAPNPMVSYPPNTP